MSQALLAAVLGGRRSRRRSPQGMQHVLRIRQISNLEARSVFRVLKRHVEVLMRVLVTDAKFRSLDDDFTGKQPEGAKQDARIRSTKDLDEVAR